MVVWSPFRFNSGRELANRFAIAPLQPILPMKMGRLPKTNSNLSDDVLPADSEPPFLPPLTSNKTGALGRE